LPCRAIYAAAGFIFRRRFAFLLLPLADAAIRWIAFAAIISFYADAALLMLFRCCRRAAIRGAQHADSAMPLLADGCRRQLFSAFDFHSHADTPLPLAFHTMPPGCRDAISPPIFR